MFATVEKYLDVGEGHQVWYAELGDPKGIPLVWLHGGPGSGSSFAHLRLIDVSGYRIILFDQRGCGRSVPLGEVHFNDTQRLVEDIERLRRALSIPRLVLGGGSWGATLALAYTMHHRDHVLALILRAPFLATRCEINDFFQPGRSDLSSAWQDFAAQAPSSERGQLLQWYGNQILSGESPRAEQLALAWARYEQARIQQVSAPPAGPEPSGPEVLRRVRVQAHFLMQNCFLAEGELLKGAAQLGNVPAAVVHGTADPICSPDNARLLAAHMPDCTLHLVPDAGHDPYHPAMAAELRGALESFVTGGDFRHWGRRARSLSAL